MLPGKAKIIEHSPDEITFNEDTVEKLLVILFLEKPVARFRTERA